MLNMEYYKNMHMASCHNSTIDLPCQFGIDIAAEYIDYEINIISCTRTYDAC